MEGLKKMFEHIGKREKIEGAVIRYDGHNYIAPNHTLAWDQVIEKHGPMPRLNLEEARGFITSRGRIVDEQTAREVALKAEQVSAEDVATEYEYPLSEMLQ